MSIGLRRGAALLVTTVLMIIIGACHKKPAPVPSSTPQPPPPVVRTTPTPPPPPPSPSPTPTPPRPPRIPSEDEVFASKSLADLNREKPLGDVLFAYDRADLTDVARAALQKNADWLRRWSTVRITVEGHADSRGTNEYNLALGERRAAAVRDYLIGLGIPTARIAVVSKGEEDPICKEETESCWEQNRRGHFLITAK
jgi:peptidoglycan-associated lipoprotein